MAFYYVKDENGVNTGLADGSDTGRFATLQTGTFAVLTTANYYSSISAAEAATTPPVSGDSVFFSDIHDLNSAVSLNLGIEGVNYFCVSDINIDQSRRAGNMGRELTTGSNGDIILTNLQSSGLILSTGDIVLYGRGNVISDGMVESRGINNTITSNTDGAYLKLVNSELAINGAGTEVLVQTGSSFIMEGGRVTTTSVIANLFLGGAANGGMHIDMFATDISSVTGTILSGVGSSPTEDDEINAKFRSCKLAAGVSFTNEDFFSLNQIAVFSGCSDSDIAAEYQYHYHGHGGDINQDTTIFRNEDEAFPVSTQKISYKIETNTQASLLSPLILDFPDAKGVLLTQTGNKKIALSITSASAITDKDVYLVASYPDATNYTKINELTTAPVTDGGTLDFLATATALTIDSSSTWTGGLAFNYVLEVDTSSLAGQDSAPHIQVLITKPSATFYLTSEPQVS
tara:strand:- start:1535 stop:2911 length:1377 start_codon:yes stop_codon:yes gene_type:complete